MKNLDYVIKIFFHSVSPYHIINGDIDGCNFPVEDFNALALIEMKHLSETDTEQLYRYLLDSNGKLNVFRIIKRLSNEMLLVYDNQPLCKYPMLLRWHEVVKCVGEDLLICAFLADRTQKTGYIWEDFEWNTVIEHDNMQLKSIMHDGIADNHFHLFGSAPTFNLIWIKLMNYTYNKIFIDSLNKINSSRRVYHTAYSSEYMEEHLAVMCFQAKVIRAVLQQYLDKALRGTPICDLFSDEVLIHNILINKEYQIMYASDIQREINIMRYAAACENPDNYLDYALSGYEKRNINHDFEGERALLYRMLLGYIKSKSVSPQIMNWFYAYIVIKNKIYNEFVQVNENIGFANFKQYTDRKNGFLYTNEDSRRMVQHAVIGSMETGNIKKLEIRITPRYNVSDTVKMIRTYDSYIKKSNMKSALERTYYVIHFPKANDETLKCKNGFVNTYRHYKYRQNLNIKADVLIQFRKRTPYEASRVLGIDACSQEIDCRPEVFGVVFRRLSNHIVRYPEPYKVKQWRITYHVGEDWRDMVDGLRAIDEAVLFLNLKNGDRLGHATVLGLDVHHWYKSKYNEITLPLQEYLDNVVWLYHKLIEYNIKANTLKNYLQNEYTKCFDMLYGSSFNQYVNEKIVQEFSKKYNLENNPEYYHVDINTYYESWKLRGDNPELYKKGFFINPYDNRDYLINEKVADGEYIRSRFKTGLLMYYYHYSADVRFKGSQPYSVKFYDFYIEGVYKVQRAMQKYISDCGIGIEANPTSNYCISAMKKYSQHPITKLYNMGLTVNPEEISNCPQMYVSINTDDKGIFSTSLENEFAVMACAMEYQKDKNGEYIYNQQMVYNWIDNIRKMGLRQSFLED